MSIVLDLSTITCPEVVPLGSGSYGVDLALLTKPAARFEQTADFPSLQLGSRDVDHGVPVVTAAQLMLRPYYVTLAVDGIFGPQTKAAVLEFQHRTRRRRTGALTPLDWRVLCDRSVIAIGSKGNAVQALQKLLNHRLHGQRSLQPRVIVDGLFGTGTLMTVRELQSQAGLRVDGIVGARTFAHLLREPGTS